MINICPDKKLYVNIWATGETLNASRYLPLFCVRIWEIGAPAKPNVYQMFRTRDLEVETIIYMIFRFQIFKKCAQDYNNIVQ